MPIHSRPADKYYFQSDDDENLDNQIKIVDIDYELEDAIESGCPCNKCPLCKRNYNNCSCKKREMYKFVFIIFMLLVIFASMLYLHIDKK